MNLNHPKIRLYASLTSGLLGMLLAYAWISHQESELLDQGRMLQVLVARRYLAATSRIEEGDFKIKAWPAAYAPRGTVSDPKDVVGLLTLAPMNPGEPLLFNKLSRSLAPLSMAVPEGLRAFSVPVDSVTGLAGLLRPGDQVDLLFLPDAGKGDASVSTLFQSVKVLAVGSLTGETLASKGEQHDTVTVALSPQDAQTAMLALSQGVLHLSLRPIGDTRLVGLASSSRADLRPRQTRNADWQAPDQVLDSQIPQKR